jgi:RIO kinase 3
MKMRKYDIPCPEVVLLKKHVLIMSFIGEESVPAPKIKEAELDSKQLQSCYDQCVQLIKDLYNRCNLVHADFNQFNLLWHKNRVWVIDVSQAVEPTHPLGLEFLHRDCCNISRFFQSKGLEAVATGEEIFMQVTGMKFDGQGDVFLSNIQHYVKEKQDALTALASERNYNFDFHFERSLKEKETREKDEGHESSDDEDQD